MAELVSLSFGPVQPFIAASRKTRDLLAGSELLGKLVAAAVRAMAENGADFIFPASAESAGDAANIILALADDGEKVAKIGEAAAQAELVKQFEDVHRQLKGVHIDESLAKAQVESFLEVFSAWTPVIDQNYSGARQELGQLMAGRKNLRDFAYAPASSEGRGKSPLNVAYESVFPLNPNSFHVDIQAQERLLLGAREGLDAISVIKRFGFEKSFPSVRKIAVADLMESANGTSELANLRNLIERGNQLLGRAGVIDEGDLFFGDVVREYPQLVSLKEELVQCRRTFLKKFNNGETPRGYFAVLLADGDRMGKALDQMASPDEHREFSHRLAASFTNKSKQVIENNLGTLVYAGGDDVLALLPLRQAVHCADELNRLFKDAMGGIAGAPTLTVAVGYSHVMQGLNDALQFARVLEKIGKLTRDCLVIGARVRSGNDLSVTLPWDDGAVSAWESVLESYQNLLIPRGFANEMIQLGNEELDERVRRLEFQRIRQRKDPVPPDSLVPNSFDEKHFLRFAELLRIGHFVTRTGGSI